MKFFNVGIKRSGANRSEAASRAVQPASGVRETRPTKAVPEKNSSRPSGSGAYRPNAEGAEAASAAFTARAAAKKRREAQVDNALKAMAPVFGVSAMQLFPCMASFIVIGHVGLPWGLSQLWLLPVLLCVLGYWSRKKRKMDALAAIGLVSDPELVSFISKEMPAWYTFRDLETMEWLNKLLQQLWPFLDYGICDNIVKNVAPPLLEGLVPGLRLELMKMSLGCVAPRVTSIRSSAASKSEFYLDVELKFPSDIYALIEVGFASFPFPLEISSASFTGLLRIKLSPLVPVEPFIGGLQISFLHKPHVDFSFKVGGFDAMSVSVPGVLDVADTVIDTIKSALENTMVYPIYLVIPLMDDDALGSMELTRPPPAGILRVEIIEGCNLPRMDRLGSVGSFTGTDSYVMVRIANSTERFQTGVKKKSHAASASWTNSTFEILVWDKDIAELRMSVMDQNALTAESSIGACALKLKSLSINLDEVHDLALQLSGTGSADKKCHNPRILAKTKWLDCCGALTASVDAEEGTTEDEAEKAAVAEEEVVDMLSPGKVIEDIGVLTVQGLDLKGVEAINESTLVGKKIYVAMDLCNEGQTTVPKINKNLPYSVSWLESFYFIAKHPGKATLKIKVMQKTGTLGTMSKSFSAMARGETTLKDKELGFIEVDLADVLKSKNSALELSGVNLTSTLAHGEVTCRVSLRMNQKGGSS